MKSAFLCLLLWGLSAWAQTPAPSAAKSEQLPADTVVATIEGKKYTAGELQRIANALPPQAQQMFAKDRKEFLRQYARLVHLSLLAEKSKLDQQSPYREQLELNRMTMLSQAAISDTHAHIVVSEEERQKYFDTHKSRFTQAKVKVIYIAFSPNASGKQDAKGKKLLTEAEAKARSEELLKKIRDGGDFVKFVKEYSDDPISAAENGDFGPIKNSDNIDASIKSAVFALKPGEVSEPVRQPNGFYIFRLEAVVTEPFDKVKDQIYNELKNQKLQQWLAENDKNLDIKIENDSYFEAPENAPTPRAAAPPSLRTPAK